MESMERRKRSESPDVDINAGPGFSASDPIGGRSANRPTHRARSIRCLPLWHGLALVRQGRTRVNTAATQFISANVRIPPKDGRIHRPIQCSVSRRDQSWLNDFCGRTTDANVAISENTTGIKVSLRRADPSEAMARNA
jgi:hypothetical protein